MKINSLVLELINKYPTLLNYLSTDQNGALKISSEGFEKIQQEELEKIQNQQSATMALSRDYVLKDRKGKVQDLKGLVGNSYSVYQNTLDDRL
jgi:hypothetical protein